MRKALLPVALLGLALAVPIEPPPKKEKPFSTAFREWIDQGEKGAIALEELVGKNTTFDVSKEKIIRFATRIIGKEGYDIHFKLYDPSGNLAVEKNGRVDSEDYVKYFGIETDKLSAKPLGNYTAIWEISKGKEQKSREILDRYSVKITRE